MDALRSFVLGFELGSFSRAADVVGRSQSAVSGHIRKLESQTGEPLVRKSGRGLVLTEAGGQLLAFGRRLLDLNDEAVLAMRASRLTGRIRFGLSADFAETWLPDILRHFTRSNPQVEIELQAERSGTLRAALAERSLDLVLAWGDGSEHPGGERLADIPMSWIAREDWRPAPGEPLAIVAYEPPCIFREAGLKALEGVNTPTRIAFNSSSLPGVWAALGAGLGVTARTAIGVPSSLVTLNNCESGLPSLPSAPLSLYQATPIGPSALRLADVIRLAIAERLVRAFAA